MMRTLKARMTSKEDRFRATLFERISSNPYLYDLPFDIVDPERTVCLEYVASVGPDGQPRRQRMWISERDLPGLLAVIQSLLLSRR